MKTIAVLLFGFVAIASAGQNHGRLRQQIKSYEEDVAAPAAPVVVEEEPAAYRAPVRVAQTPRPIRVNNDYGYSNSNSKKYDEDRHRYEDEANRNAQYKFASAVDDGIMDHSHIRQETRDGLKVEGSYAYSDGYFKRTVSYIADENGYRVVSESVEPISESGPVVDLVNGKADVHTQISGVDSSYSVTAQEIPSNRPERPMRN